MDTTNEYLNNGEIINNFKNNNNNYDKSDNNFITPKKAILNALISSEHKSPRSDLQSIHLLNISNGPLHILKERYLLTNYNNNKSLTNLKCTDIYTDCIYKCKLINDNYNKITFAYYKLLNSDNYYKHKLIQSIHDAVKINNNSTYLIISNNNYGDLHTYVKTKRKICENEANKLFKQICQTVQLCHSNGIIIRDLKLKNFVFVDDEKTQLQYECLDGSIILDDPNDDTLTEKIGCPLYVAPELITTNLEYGGYASDIWSLGVILYTMLIGRYPFSDQNGQVIFHHILRNNVIIPNSLSSKAKCLIKSLLMKDPNNRLIADDVLDHQWFNNDNFNDNQFQCDNYHFVPDLDLEDDIKNIINS